MLLAVLLAMVPGSVPAISTNAAPTLESMRRDYELSLQKQQAESGVAAIGKGNDYIKSLAALADTLQKAGDLEGLVAAKQEKERFEKEKQVPPQSPAGLPPPVIKLQTDYRKNLAQAETEKYTGLISLTDKYVGQLNALKKQMTVDGQIDEALKMKAEADRVKSSPPVSAAQFALAELVAKKEAASAPVEGAVETVPCIRCNGTGRVAPDCLRCGGSGRCVSCKGKGQVPSMLKGMGGVVRCTPCKGTGKCRECSNADKMVACTACKGSGVLAKAPPPRIYAPRYTSSPPPAAPSNEGRVDSAAKALVDSELDQYLETMASLHAQFKNGSVGREPAEKVLANPLQYGGKVLQSKVYLINGHPRGIRVAATRDAIPKGGTLLVPYSMDVGMKAQDTSKEVGANGEVVITYGVVNRDNITLFAISR